MRPSCFHSGTHQIADPFSRLIVLCLITAGLAITVATANVMEPAAAPDTPLFKGLRGKVVLLDFWASWCDPCRQSFPWMSELQRRYAASDLVVAINLDQDRKRADKFLAAVPAGFRIEFDPNGNLATQFGVTAMPMSFLIDRSGNVRERHRGFRDGVRAEREQAIAKLLKE